jgi:hypothetical protein
MEILRRSRAGLNSLLLRPSSPHGGQDVLCYHNFKTGIKVLEHHMTKEIFMDIVKSNLTAEYINSTRAFAKGERVPQPSSVLTARSTAQREADWDQRLKEMMARRIQNMAHLWFGRKSRSKFTWKLEQRRVNEKRSVCLSQVSTC